VTSRAELPAQSAEPSSLDLTQEEEPRLLQQVGHIDLREPPLQPYDPRPQEDKARRNIAYALIGLLFLVVFAVIGLVGSGAIGVADIKEFGVIIGPLVALVSAATGFYYGNR
jgi:hypothetical protein